MKWFAVIDFRDDKFSRQRVINISVDIKTVGKDWLEARIFALPRLSRTTL
eukprot:GAHX01004115.1.p1 GENE.GAHX01004115.1~~GAHX01004115.1.p1  ORF type:complete len:50 (-),score=1.37 GAHX01004115.1:256-405(-)